MGAKKNRNNKLRERVTPLVIKRKHAPANVPLVTNMRKPTSIEKTIARVKRIERIKSTRVKVVNKKKGIVDNSPSRRGYKRKKYALRTSNETA